MSLFTIRQVQDRLNVSRACVYSLIESGRLPCIRIGIGRGTIRVDESDLNSFILASRSQPKPRVSRISAENEFRYLDADRLRSAWSEGE
jgi:excisionase family DNA binding protein